MTCSFREWDVVENQLQQLIGAAPRHGRHLRETRPSQRTARSARLPLRVFVSSHRTQNRLQQFTQGVALLRTEGSRGLRCLLDTLFLRWAAKQIAARLPAKAHAPHGSSPRIRVTYSMSTNLSRIRSNLLTQICGMFSCEYISRWQPVEVFRTPKSPRMPLCSHRQ